jgi:hypothetical protein
MGAGISKERESQLKYRLLKQVERELNLANIPAVYRNKAVAETGLDETSSPFFISIGTTLRASNGEAFGDMKVTVLNPNTNQRETYRLFDARKGVERIKTLYGMDKSRRVETDLQRLAIQVEAEFRKAHDRLWNHRQRDAAIFLHDEGGKRLAQNGGQIYAYNEFRDGKVMCRLGGSSDSYVEFRPGYTVRDEAGTVLLCRARE